ncbi:MAG: hypothetical protein AAFZ15_12330 [Bacteroidota bacterium]
MNSPLKLTTLLLLFSTALLSQDYLGGIKAESFYQTKSKLYQYWMENNGIGQMLKVDKYELKKNGHELELFLTVNTRDPDSAAAMWIQLVRAYDDANQGEKLIEVLFKTFTRMMEIPPAQGNVQVYVPHKDGFGYDACFYIWIWEENGRVKEESRIHSCRAERINVLIQPPKITTVSNKASVMVDQNERARVVFDSILAYAQRRFENKKHYDRFPRVAEEDRTDDMLMFSVTDLSKEVLHKEDLSPWCKFMVLIGRNCNDMRRERLEFTIYYTPGRTGFRLSGSVKGKFGIGPFEPRNSAYMDMDPDFEDDFLKPYVRLFQKQLKAYLEQMH